VHTIMAKDKTDPDASLGTKEAEAPASTPTQASTATSADAVPTPRTPNAPQTVEPTCPTCGGPLDVYTGSNPHKVDTGFCVTCGLRHRLEG
jgi:hypothetical protein